MLYLILQKSECKVKVGYSSQRGRNGILARMKAYKTHNPSFICRSYCRGGREDEKYCHNILCDLGTKEKGSEWVEIPKEIYDELYNKGMGYFYNKIPITFLEE